jgi:hypothetical protein
MAQKHRRSNREAKKPKQEKKTKPTVSTSPIAALHGNPARSFAARRK